ncbi:MAG: hypothetical protein Q4C49_14315 [Bacillota bacterium]|nr:hypothetical protein [Bacillota bacterium]
MKLIVYKEPLIGTLLSELTLDYQLIMDEKKLLTCLEKKDVVFIKRDMALVEKIMELGCINVIYVSKDTSECAIAFKNHVSGYLVEPINSENILNELKFLRFGEWNKPYIRCFGNFDLLLQGKSITFPRKKAQDVLAYLVFKKGDLVTVDELQDIIFGERSDKNRKYVYVLKFECSKVLESHGISGVLEVVGNRFRINKDAIECDYYQYLEGNEELYQGEFMKQFNWAKELPLM